MKASEELQDNFDNSLAKIRSLKSKVSSLKKEKDKIDSAAEDLFER